MGRGRNRRARPRPLGQNPDRKGEPAGADHRNPTGRSPVPPELRRWIRQATGVVFAPSGLFRTAHGTAREGEFVHEFVTDIPQLTNLRTEPLDLAAQLRFPKSRLSACHAPVCINSDTQSRESVILGSSRSLLLRARRDLSEARRPSRIHNALDSMNRSLKNHTRALAALGACATVLSTAGAAAQEPISFGVDSTATMLTYGGTTPLGPIVGNPPNFSFTGDVSAVVDSIPGAGPVSIEFVPGGAAAVVPDIDAIVPNPVPFLPALATLEINGLVLSLSSAPAAVDPAGNFSTMLDTTVLAGTLDVTVIGQAPTSIDLTGNVGLPQPFTGNIATSGASSTISGMLAITFLLADPALPVTATVNVNGTIAASHTSPAPTASCVATANSTGAPALLTTSGTPSLAASDLVLEASSIPPNQFCLFIAARDDAFVPNFGGSQGNLCLGGSLIRLNAFVQNAGGAGQVTLPMPYGQIPGTTLECGETWYFQAWFRDSLPGIPVTSNTTNGVRVTFAP